MFVIVILTTYGTIPVYVGGVVWYAHECVCFICIGVCVCVCARVCVCACRVKKLVFARE